MQGLKTICSFLFFFSLQSLSVSGSIQLEKLESNQYKLDSVNDILKTFTTDSAKANHCLQLSINTRYDNPLLAIEYGLLGIEISKKAQLNIQQVEGLTELGFNYELQGNGKKALKYYYDGYLLAIEIDYPKGAIDGLNGSASSHWLLGNLNQASKMYLKTIELAKTYKMTLRMADAYNNIGNVYLDQGLFNLSLENYQKAAKILPDNNRTKAITILNIGLIHFELEDMEKGSHYFSEGSRLAHQQNDLALEGFGLKMLGMILRKQGKFEDALEKFEQSILIYKRMNNQSMVLELYLSIGNVYYDLSKYEQSLASYKSCIKNSIQSENTATICHALIGMSNCYLYSSKYENAKKTLIQAEKLAVNTQKPRIYQAIYEAYSNLYAKTSQYELAFENYKQYTSIKDSLFNVEKSAQITKMEAQFGFEKKEKEIILLNADKEISRLTIERQVVWRNYGLGLFAIVSILLAFFYYRYRVRTKANEKLKELDQLKTNFFANISHEFRTPLTLILGPLERQLEENKDPAIHKELNLMHRNASRLLVLINQLLDLSKLEDGKLSLTVSPTDIYPFLKGVASSYGSLAEYKDIEYKITIPFESQEILLDREKVQSIIDNLLSNAFKFTQIGGRINLSASIKNQQLHLVISDNGIGIKEGQIDKIFERFHRLVEQNATGTGIGLALTKEFVELHLGTIEVKSTPTYGTEFTVKIPADPKAYPETSITSDFHDDSSFEIKTQSTFSTEGPIKEEEYLISDNTKVILIVEDNLDVRNYIKQALSDNYIIKEALDGEEGMEQATSFVPDLIISDLMMPKMDGIELCEKLKTDQRTSHIPLILLTAKADGASKIKGLTGGADDYLTKPFNTKELLVRIDNLITQRAKLRERFGKTITLQPAEIEIVPTEEIFINRTMEIIEENLSNSEFTVVEFQNEIGMSRMQLHRKLKALTGQSATGFIRMIRLKRAAQLLETSDFSVSEIAFKSGFNNLSYFAKCFKEQFGELPSKYR